VGGVVRPKFVLENVIGYARGDFDLPPKPGKISHVLLTKAIFRCFLIFYSHFCRFLLKFSDYQVYMSM